LFGIIRGVVIVTVIVMLGTLLTARVAVIGELFGESILVPYIMVLAGFFQDLFGLSAAPVTGTA
jgi:hypothetical protein